MLACYYVFDWVQTLNCSLENAATREHEQQSQEPFVLIRVAYYSVPI
jgi:hypothetical protein